MDEKESIPSTTSQFFRFLRGLINISLIGFFIASCIIFIATYYLLEAYDVVLLSTLFTMMLTVFVLTTIVEKRGPLKTLRWFNHTPMSFRMEFFLFFMIIVINEHLYYVNFTYSTPMPNVIEEPSKLAISLIWALLLLIGISIIHLQTKALSSLKRYVLELADFHYIHWRLMNVIPLYIGIDIIFALIYRIQTISFPRSFNQPISSFIDAFYYSTVTITTLGYGDIVPLDQSVRFLAATEALIGIVFIGAIIAAAITLPQSSK